MNTIKYIVKGILLWGTMLSFMLFIAGGAESLVNAGYYFNTFAWLGINILLIYLCKCVISYREFYKLTGYQLFNKICK